VRQVAESVIDLADVELIILYEDEKEAYLQFVDFDDHQIGLRKEREAPSKIPSPEELRIDSGVTPRKYKELSLSLSKKESKEEKIYYCFKSRKWANIEQQDFDLWIEAYPACDVKTELLKMADWLLSNPKNKKSNYRRFITNWLKRQQDRERGGGARAEHKVSQVGKTRKEDETSPGWDKHAQRICDEFWKKNKKRRDALMREGKPIDDLNYKLEAELNRELRKFREKEKEKKNV
jgi:hypothetical protein